MNTVFFGASAYILSVLENLHTNFGLCLVVTTEKDTTGTVPAFCNKNSIPYLSIKEFDRSVFDKIKKTRSAVGVLASFGIIVPIEVLRIFPKGIVNIHPSLLPKYRGATPVQSAILNMEKQTGVSIIVLDEQTDHGPLLLQESEEIRPEDTTDSLQRRLFEIGTGLLIKALPAYIKGTLSPKLQDESQATYSKNTLIRQDGFVDIKHPPSKEVLRAMIRAYYPWPGVFTTLLLNKKEVRVKFLPNRKFQVEGKQTVSMKDFINGYPEVKKQIENLFD